MRWQAPDLDVIVWDGGRMEWPNVHMIALCHLKPQRATIAAMFRVGSGDLRSIIAQVLQHPCLAIERGEQPLASCHRTVTLQQT